MSYSKRNTSTHDETYQSVTRSFAESHVTIPFQNYGSFTIVSIQKAEQYNSGSASGTQGHLGMSSHGANSYTGAPQLNGDDSHSLDAAAPARTPTPEDHLEQADDWFKAGRFFSIWAHEDQEIHKKKFVLLDSMNKEGKGVLVESLDRDGLRRLQQSSSAYRTHVELRKSRPAVPPDMQPTATGPTPQPVGPSGISKAIYPSSYAEAAAHPRGKRSETPLVPEMKFKFAYMDEYVHRDVAPNTYILLEHTYNIPFFKYKCEDHGMLDDDSLQDLRQYYVDYLSHRWRLGSRQK